MDLGRPLAGSVPVCDRWWGDEQARTRHLGVNLAKVVLF